MSKSATHYSRNQYLNLIYFSVVVLLCSCSFQEPRDTELPASINLLDINGKPRLLDDYLGSNTLLILWASWCQECVAELALLNDSTRSLARHDIQVLAVAIQDDLESVRALPHWRGSLFPILIDSKNQMLSHYPADGLPGAYLLDRKGFPIPLIDPQDGKIKDVIIGMRNWRGSAALQAIEQSVIRARGTKY